jgi:hypothetical protein
MICARASGAIGRGAGEVVDRTAQLALGPQANRRIRLSAVRASFNDVTRTPAPHAST